MNINNNVILRDNYWDNIKGFLIFLVVFGHFLYYLTYFSLNNNVVNALYMFHMEAFVFVSGFFSKSEHSKSFHPLFNLAVSFIILQFGFVFYGIFFMHQNPSPVVPLCTSWYILALIIWRITVSHLAKIKFIIGFLFILSILSLFCQDINIQFGMNKVIFYYPFFMSGYLLNPEKIKSIRNIPKIKKYIISIVLLFITIVLGTLLYNTFNITKADLIQDIIENCNINHIFARISIYIISFLMIIFMLFFFNDKKLPFLTKIGKNSFSIYLVHCPFMLAFTYFAINYTNDIQIILSILFTVLLCIVFGADIINNLIKKILDNFYYAATGEQEIKYPLLYQVLILFMIIFIFIMPFLMNKIT